MAHPAHLAWLVNTGKTLKTKDGYTVELWELKHETDAGILSAWAKHFREHYCDDTMLDALVQGTGLSKKDFLLQQRFPDPKDPPGPSVRAGDFAEIIMADYIEYKLGYWSPRQLRYDLKFNRNESTKGCDVIGFKFAGGTDPTKDELFVFEAKASLSGSKPDTRLQVAIDHSNKDQTREAMTLSALKQRFIERGDKPSATKVERFQNQPDRPFVRVSGAAAIHDTKTFQATDIANVTAAGHYNSKNLKLIVVTGSALMQLVHALYDRGANEA